MRQFIPFDLVIPHPRSFPKEITPKQSTEVFAVRRLMLEKNKQIKNS